MFLTHGEVARRYKTRDQISSEDSSILSSCLRIIKKKKKGLKMFQLFFSSFTSFACLEHNT